MLYPKSEENKCVLSQKDYSIISESGNLKKYIFKKETCYGHGALEKKPSEITT